MRLNELTFKILDISIKNNLLMGYSAKVNSTLYMEAFVNTSVMVRPAQVAPYGKQAAGSWIILTLRHFIDGLFSAKVNSTHLYGSICEYLRHGAPCPGGTIWKTSRRVMDYPDPAAFYLTRIEMRISA